MSAVGRNRESLGEWHKTERVHVAYTYLLFSRFLKLIEING